MRRLRERMELAAILFVAAALGVVGLRWGLPSKERNRFYFPDGKYPVVPEQEVRESAKIYPEFSDAAPRPRSTFNAIRSCHPDEHYVLKGLANMDPLRGDFTTGLYGWPSLIFYLEGAGIAAAHLAGWVTLTHNVRFYFEHPEQIARMYLVGRFIVVLFGAAAVAAIYAFARYYYGRQTAAMAALCAASTPLLTVHMHYLTGDVVMLFFLSLGLWGCVRTYGSHRARWPILAGAAFGLAMSAKYKAVLLLPMIPAAAAMRPSLPKGWRVRLVHALAPPVAAGVAAAFVVFAAFNIQIVLHPARFWRIFSGEVVSVAANACQAGVGVGVRAWLARAADIVSRALSSPADVLVRTMGPWPLVFALCEIARAVVFAQRRDYMLIVGFGITYLALGVIGTMYSRHLMPLLPFLAVLAGRFVAAGWSRVQWRAARAGLTFLTGALLFGSGMWKSIAYDRLFSSEDIRLKAARWIHRRVPPGRRIGMPETPWQYDTPPIDEHRHPIVVTGYDADKLMRLRPEYYLVSSRHRDPVLRKPTPARRRFWAALFNPAHYAPAREFVANPFIYRRTASTPYEVGGLVKLLGFDLANDSAPEDMRYANPRITLLRRADLDE